MHSPCWLKSITTFGWLSSLRMASIWSFQCDTRTIYAVTRCLEIISEASRRLPEEIKARHHSTPWLEIAGARLVP